MCNFTQIYLSFGDTKICCSDNCFTPPAHTSTGSARAAPAPPTQIPQMSRLGVSVTYHEEGDAPSIPLLRPFDYAQGERKPHPPRTGRDNVLARGEGEWEGDVGVAVKEALPGSGADFLGGFDDGGFVDGEDLAVSH